MNKIPRFTFDKFTLASNVLSTQMKATGETMGIGRTMEESLLKAIRSLEDGKNHIHLAKFDVKNLSDKPEPENRKEAIEKLLSYIEEGTDDRIYAISELLWLGVDEQTIYDRTKIDLFFLNAIIKISFPDGQARCLPKICSVVSAKHDPLWRKRKDFSSDT